VAATAVLAAYPAVASGALGEPFAALGIVACLALAAGVAGHWAVLVQTAFSLLLGEYAAFLLERGDVDARAPLFAAGLIAAAELGYAALEPPATTRALLRGAALLAVVAAGAAALGVLLLAAAAASGGSLAEEIVGFAAATAAIALVARLAWTARTR
jgi:hypothetical protein